MRSYYRSVVGRALSDSRHFIGAHVLFAVLVLVGTYAVGVVTGTALSAKAVTTRILYPLAALAVVALLVLGAELVLAPVRLATDRATEAAEATAALKIENAEVRVELQRLAAETDSSDQARTGESQFAAALRTGDLLLSVQAPWLDREWIAFTEQLLRESLGQLDASRFSPQERVSDRLPRLQELASDITKGTRSIRPSPQWKAHTTIMVNIAAVLSTQADTGQWIRDKLFFTGEITSVEEAEKWVEAWLSDLSVSLALVPSVRKGVERLVEPQPYWSYTGLSPEVGPILWRLDRQLPQLRAVLPTLEAYARELGGEDALDPTDDPLHPTDPEEE